MKKVFNLFIVLILFLFVDVKYVNAATLTPDKASIEVGKSVTLQIGVKQGIAYSLDFESAYFDVSSSTCGNRSEINSDCTIKLTAKKALSLTDDKQIEVVLTPEENDDIKKSIITILANNKTTTTTTTTTKTTTTSSKSNNANLKSLEVTTSNNEKIDMSPNFSPSVYEYQMNVDSTCKTVLISALPEDSKASVIMSNASTELKAGENNIITIKVTAEDGTLKQYVLNIKRGALSANATLKELKIEEYKDFVFDPDKYSYDIKLDSDIDKLTIYYETTEEGATVKISGNNNLKNGSIIKIIVVAEDETTRQYKLNIIKEEDKAVTSNIEAEKSPLIIMVLSMIAFVLIGGIVYVIKK